MQVCDSVLPAVAKLLPSERALPCTCFNDVTSFALSLVAAGYVLVNMTRVPLSWQMDFRADD